MGGGILIIKRLSLPNLLATVYPAHDWNPQSFVQQYSNIWTSEHLATYFVEWLKKQPSSEILHVQSAMKYMRKKGDFALVQQLKAAFPQYSWIITQASAGRKAQYELKQCIEKLFNKEKNNVLLEEYKHPDIANLELDYFLPQYNIAFEYQVMKESYL